NFIYQSVETLFNDGTNSMILYILVGTWFCCTAISVFYCVRCFIPKIEGKFDKNILFFEDVITKFGTVKEFANTFYEISKDDNQLFKQMGEQIFIISKIASWKFKNVRIAIRFLAINLSLLLVVACYYSINSCL
ncbi:MAG: Pycsar system effector family protein, partial [Melioribacteraceae bacterium]